MKNREKTENIIKNNEHILSGLLISNIGLTAIPEEENRTGKKLYKEITATIFPNQKKSLFLHLHIQYT